MYRYIWVGCQRAHVLGFIAVGDSAADAQPDDDGSLTGRRVRMRKDTSAQPATNSVPAALDGILPLKANSSSGIGGLTSASTLVPVSQITTSAAAALINSSKPPGMLGMSNLIPTTGPVSTAAFSTLYPHVSDGLPTDWISMGAMAAAAGQQQAAQHTQQLQQAAALQAASAQAHLQAAGWPGSAQNPYLAGLWPYNLYAGPSPNWAAAYAS